MIKPLGKNVTAQLVEGSKVTKSGIFLPSGASENLAPKIAKVVAIGSEVVNVAVGDEVVFKPYAIYDVKTETAEYVMIEEIDILGVVVPDEPAEK